MANTITTTQTRQYYESSRLSVAAYAKGLTPKMPESELVAVLVSKDIGMSPAEASAFASRYEVAAPTFEGPSGAQVNIFRDGARRSMVRRSMVSGLTFQHHALFVFLDRKNHVPESNSF